MLEIRQAAGNYRIKIIPMSFNPDSNQEGGQHPEPERALAPRQLYELLCQRLSQHGETHPPDLVSGDTAETLALYAEVPTASFGTAIITDEDASESHVAFAGTDKASEADRRALLADNLSILTITFPEMAGLDRGKPHPWNHFYAARPADLRGGSHLWEIYNHVSGGSYNVAPERRVFFNEHDLETSPGHIPPLAELGKSLLAGQQ